MSVQQSTFNTSERAQSDKLLSYQSRLKKLELSTTLSGGLLRLLKRQMSLKSLLSQKVKTLFGIFLYTHFSGPLAKMNMGLDRLGNRERLAEEFLRGI